MKTSITWRDWLTIAAILLSPVIAFVVNYVLVHIWLSDKNRKRQRKDELLYNLIRARNALVSLQNKDVFEEAINAIPFVFNDDQEVLQARKAFWDAAQAQQPEQVRRQKLIKLILIISRQMGYKRIEESTIDEFFMLSKADK